MSLLQKATLITTPTAHSNGTLHSIKGGAVADFDVVRGSAATRVNAEGIIESVATNIPRIDYTTGEGVVLLEPQSTNLITHSEDFSNASWENASLGTTPILETGYLAPDGTNNAFKISNANKDSFWYTIPSVIGSSTTRSIYARTTSGTGQAHLLTHNSNTDNLFTITEQWQRFDINTANATGVDNLYGVDFRGSTNLSEIILWGANATNDQDYATSYIPTSGAIATRLADLVTGAGDANTFNSTEGVLYFEAAALVNDGTNRIISLSKDGDITNRVNVFYTSGSNKMNFVVRVSNVKVFERIINLTDIVDYNKVALSFKENEFKVFINGAKEAEQLSGSTYPINTLDKFNFDQGSGSLPFQGKVKALAVFNEALTDSELECLTTI